MSDATERPVHPSMPTFIAIGAGRCGTTSLHGILSQHPEIAMSRTKEPCYFHLAGSGVDLDRLPPDARKKWGASVSGQAAYRALFTRSPKTKAIGEISPIYLTSPRAPSMIARQIPHVRLIALVRDPIERALSHHRHNMVHGFEKTQSFEHAFRRDIARGEHSEYYRAGMYAHHLSVYGRFFEREQIHVIEQGQFSRDPSGVLAKVCRFIGVDDGFKFNSKTRSLKTDPSMNEASAWMSELYRDDMNELADRYGVDTSRWTTPSMLLA